MISSMEYDPGILPGSVYILIVLISTAVDKRNAATENLLYIYIVLHSHPAVGCNFLTIP